MQAMELVLAIPLQSELSPEQLPLENEQLHLENTYWNYSQKKAMPALCELFQEAISHPISAEEMARVQSHGAVLFIKGQVKHPKDLLVLSRYLQTLLEKEQSGVYVQNAGLCHSADFWKHLASEESLDAAIELFVGLHLGEGFMLTQGMEVLGVPDIMVKTDDPDYARELLLTVCLDGIATDSLKKNARIMHGDDEQVYRLQEVDVQQYLPESQNPAGLLRLVKSF